MWSQQIRTGWAADTVSGSGEVDALTVALRFALYVDLMLLFGASAFVLHALRGAERRVGEVLPSGATTATTAIVALALSSVSLVSLAASMAGATLAIVDRAAIDAVLWGMPIGVAWRVRMVALAVALVSVLLWRRAPALAAAICALSGAVALGSLAWSGHGAMDAGGRGWLHLLSDIVHLLAAGIWIGTLFALLLLVFRPARRADRVHLARAHHALKGFSATGTFVVLAIVLTGLANSWLVVGPAALLSAPGTLYGQLLIAKLVLFAAMLGLAAANRYRLVPRFERALAAGDHAAALIALRASLLIETGGAVAILALVAWLGTLAPAAG
jgi:putative copper resistance protein D